jgi:signal transduction histidine kinase
MSGTRVYIEVIDKGDKVEISLKNIAADEINFSADEILERFVRGDKARNTEGSGLGLAIAKSFVELQGGKFEIEVEADLFKVQITFNKG